jgi:hypothetical protein
VTYSVRITLLGRRNGGPVPNVGRSIRVGKFPTFSHAREAAQSWDRDTDFRWRARVVEIKTARPQKECA